MKMLRRWEDLLAVFSVVSLLSLALLVLGILFSAGEPSREVSNVERTSSK